jgi:hypothetical protein
MIKNNLLGQILIGIIVVLLLISSIQMFGWGVGIDSITIDEENLEKLPSIPKSTSGTELVSNIDSKTMLDEIGKRPMFSEDRLPFVEPDIVLVNEPGPEFEIPELKAQLTGVVITPEQSYAMILDTTTNLRETYKVGMPLDGEQGGWTLDSIQSRKVTLVSDDDRTVELELEVHSQQLKVNKTSGQSSSATNNNDSDNEKNDEESIREEKKKNADDIRKKIAERRAQMRAEAAKKNQ